MELTEEERKYLTILTEARLINERLICSYEKVVRKFVNLSHKKLKHFLEKFVKEGLL